MCISSTLRGMRLLELKRLLILVEAIAATLFSLYTYFLWLYEQKYRPRLFSIYQQNVWRALTAFIESGLFSCSFALMEIRWRRSRSRRLWWWYLCWIKKYHLPSWIHFVCVHLAIQLHCGGLNFSLFTYTNLYAYISCIYTSNETFTQYWHWLCVCTFIRLLSILLHCTFTLHRKLWTSLL